MNNKGFTLVELLAVLIILTVIMGIAIPSISSSLQRTKNKQNDAKKKMIESYAEEFVTDYKNAVYKQLEDAKVEECKITINMLKKYLPDGTIEDADGNPMSGCVVFTKPNSYKYCASGTDECDVTNDCITTEN